MNGSALLIINFKLKNYAREGNVMDGALNGDTIQSG
jgi:hypothetical protein